MALCLCTVAMYGCGKNKNTAKEEYTPGVFVEDVEKRIDAMAPDDVLVAVNGNELTLEDYKRLLQHYEMELKLKHRNARDSKLQVQLGMQWKSKSAIEEFVDREAVLAEAERLKLEALPENIKKTTDYAEMVQKASGVSYDEFCKQLSYTPESYRRKLQQDALRMTLRDVVFTNDLSATERELEIEKKRYEAYNQRCEATNQVVMARAEKLVQQLRGGADFEELARHWSEAPEGQPVIEELSRSQIYEPEIQMSAFELPVGSVSDPLDTESGLFIIKIFDRNEITAEQAGAGERSTVKMGSILLRLGQFYPCPSDDELRGFITNEKQKYVYRKYLNDLRDKCRIVYPNGTNFWEKTENKGAK
jgi:hypothetical protein